VLTILEPPNQSQPIQTEGLEHLYHHPSPNTGMQAPELIVNAMLDTYWKCGGIEDAKRLFD
jgi:hypothetical protein